MEPLTWKTLEFEEKDRHPDWIWYAGLIALAVAIISFLLSNLFFGIFAIIAGATVIVMSFHKPRELTISIEEKGILVNEEMIPFVGIKQFWLDESQKPDKLLLLVPGNFIPLRVLHLEGVTVDQVREAIKSKAEESFLRESFGVKIMERLGF